MLVGHENLAIVGSLCTKFIHFLQHQTSLLTWICSLQSYFGANVLHPRTIIPVMKDNIPIVIRNMFNLSAPGTVICTQPANEDADLDACVKSFATIDKVALVNVEG